MPASFDSLPLAVMERIVAHLEPRDQGRLACTTRLCRQAVAPRVPALYHYACRGKASEVVRLLRTPVGCAAIDVRHGKRKRTALHAAAEHARADVATALLAAGAAADCVDSRGEAIFVTACQHALVVGQFLAAGADPNTASPSDGRTALMAVCTTDNRGAVRKLLAAGADVSATNFAGQTALMKAAQRGALGAVEMLLASPSANVRAVDRAGISALHMACEGQSLQIPTLLIRAGADINQASNDGHTPLMMACRPDGLGVLKALIEAGAEAGAASESGETALMLVAENCHSEGGEFAEELIEAGAPVDAVDCEGRSAADIAAAAGNLEALEILLDAGARVPGQAGYKALIYAYDFGIPVMAEALWAGGAAVGSLEEFGRWPVLIPAAAAGDLQLVERLIQEGATVDATHDFGSTPLIFAARYGHAAVVQRLIQAGAAIGRAGRGGKTALALALEHRHGSVVQALLAAGAVLP